jgi:uncharacterized caspase-like protein
MTHFTAPVQPLTDVVVALRLPSADAGGVDAVRGYTEQEQPDGGRLPEIPLAQASAIITDTQPQSATVQEVRSRQVEVMTTSTPAWGTARSLSGSERAGG